jgi:hypothetical protein
MQKNKKSIEKNLEQDLFRLHYQNYLGLAKSFLSGTLKEYEEPAECKTNKQNMTKKMKEKGLIHKTFLIPKAFNYLIYTLAWHFDKEQNEVVKDALEEFFEKQDWDKIPLLSEREFRVIYRQIESRTKDK